MSAEFTYENLVAEIARLIEVDPAELSEDANLIDWGLDSVSLMMLIEQFRGKGAQISFAQLAENPTPAGFWQILKTP